MDLSEFWAAARRFTWVIVALCLVGAGLGAFLDLRTPGGYVAQVKLFATSAKADNVQVSQSSSLALQRMDSYVRLVGTQALADGLVSQLNLDRSSREVADGISATVDRGTVLMSVEVEAPSAQEAERIAAAIPGQLTTLITRLADKSATNDTTTMSLVDGPYTSRTRSLTALLRSVLLGAFLGLTLGAIAVAVRARFQRGLRSPDALRELTGMPVVGIIPADKSFDLTQAKPTRRNRWNAYRRLALNLRLLLPGGGAPLIAVSGPKAGVGATETAQGLAAALSAAGQSVLLVDTVRSGTPFPDLGDRTDSVGGHNLSVSAIVSRPGLHVASLPIKEGGARSGVGGGDVSRALRAQRDSFDAIVVDIPPVLTSVESAPIVDLADAVLVVVEQLVTSAQDINASTLALKAMGAATSAGFVLNQVAAGSVDQSQLLAGVSVPPTMVGDLRLGPMLPVDDLRVR